MKIPTTTYRIQFHKDFNFQAANKIISYLEELGITDLYASPIFQARVGSMHGYDVVDANQLNPELGTEKDFEKLSQNIQKKNMGWLQDIVPNHMAYDPSNRLLMDVLEHGADSEYFDYFDIAWNAPYGEIKQGILAPLLGNFYSESLENGDLKLEYNQDGLTIDYFGKKFPIRIESYSIFLTHNLGKLNKNLGRKSPEFVKLLGILYIIKNLPSESKGRERYDQVAFLKSLLWDLYENQSEIQFFFNENLRTFNGEPGKPDSYNLLDSLLSDQFYRLSFWKVGAEEINYRRFFTVNELISVRVENPKVFYKSHALIAQLVADGKITGLRIDHIDGLYDPKQYLERLKEKTGDTYISVEKILEPNENLPPDWPVQGTSGYDYLNIVNGVFCQQENEEKIDEIYQKFTKQYTPYEELALDKKELILDKNLAGDVDNLAKLLKNIAEQSRYGRDFTVYGLKRALMEILKSFPIYRTYIDETGLRNEDKDYINEAIENAKEQVPQLIKEVQFIQQILLQEDIENQQQKNEQIYFAMRMQQLTGPLMAKGIEDTLLYVYNRLISLNEVGGAPNHFGISRDTFHNFNIDRQKHWPHAQNATATHDTKRGEDVRARLNILSEIPEQWEEQINKWTQINRSHKTKLKRRTLPETNDEYFFYQTLLGSFPFNGKADTDYIKRMKEYVIKAVKEAKVNTAWLRPDTEYEESYTNFVENVLTSKEFLQEFLPFQKIVSEYGIYNSLAQTLLKATSPGIPDFYQGTELWEFSHVDPDNRRPVNYQERLDILTEIKPKIKSNILQFISQLLEEKESGKIKLYLTYQLLQTRKQNSELFANGDYQPLPVTGLYQNHIIAYARHYKKQTALIIAPRFLTSLIKPGEYPLGDIWQDTQIHLFHTPSTPLINPLTQQELSPQQTIKISQIFQHFPVALLIN